LQADPRAGVGVESPVPNVADDAHRAVVGVDDIDVDLLANGIFEKKTALASSSSITITYGAFSVSSGVMNRPRRSLSPNAGR